MDPRVILDTSHGSVYKNPERPSAIWEQGSADVAQFLLCYISANVVFLLPRFRPDQRYEGQLQSHVKPWASDHLCSQNSGLVALNI